MISIFGLNNNNKTKWDILHAHILNKLKKEFHSLYTTEAEFALGLLPFGVDYDSSKKIITEKNPYSRFNKKIALQCE